MIKYLLFPTVQAARGRNTSLQNQIKNRINNYNASEWSHIWVNNVGDTWAISIKDTDPRKPQDDLTPNEKNNLVNLDSDWYIILSDGRRQYHYA